MPEGSCMCGEYRHEYSEDPVAVAVCHCVPCTKNSGQTGSMNTLVKSSQYTKTSGKELNWTRKGDSGKQVTYQDCAKCGTIMTVTAEALGDMVIFKTGTLDDQEAVEQSKPAAEVYTKYRPGWCEGFKEAMQKEGA